MPFQKSYPIFSVGNDVKRPEYEFEPKYRVIMLTIEEWIRGPRTPLAVKGHVWYTDGSKTPGGGGSGAGVYGQSLDRRLSLCLGKFAAVFKVEKYSVLTSDYEIELKARLENCYSVCSDNRTALEALSAAEITSPLVQQCQRAWNDISIPHSVGQFWVLGHSGICGNEIADGLFTSVSDLNWSWGFRGRLDRKISSAGSVTSACQCGRFIRALRDRFEDRSQDLSPAAKTRLLSFNRMQPRVVTCLLTGRNTLRNHLYISGLIDSSLCRRCGAGVEISAHVLCECVALTTIRLI